MPSTSPQMAQRARRRLRRDLILFLDTLCIFLQAGYELGFAWPQTWLELGDELGDDFRRVTRFGSEEAFSAFLIRLGQGYPDSAHGLWLEVLSELYTSGASLLPGVAAIGQALRVEQERDWQAHVRSLPLKISLVLGLCFLPCALALIFLPFIQAFSL